MFNRIRYWFQSKAFHFKMWMHRPSSVEKAVKQVVSSMENLGIVIVDATVHAEPRHGRSKPASEVIVTGYLRDKACIFTVNFNYGFLDTYKFTIQGQMDESKQGDIVVGTRALPLLERSPVSMEGGGCRGTFNVNTCTTYTRMSSKSSNKKVVYGMAFFEKFLDLYGEQVASKFTKNVHLWFVPEGSEEFKVLQEKNGQYNQANYAGFNSRVMAKFPVGFFCKTQEA